MVGVGQLRHAYDELVAGRISRRTFLERAAALGVAPSLALLLGRTGHASAQQGSPVAGIDFPGAPSVGTEGQTRGAGGELKLRLWQEPSTFSVHTTRRARNLLVAALVTEPLLHILPNGTLIPCLTEEVPSFANGLLARDLSSVTYRLREGIVWSDGTPLTAKDVVFTWQWIMDEANQSTSVRFYERIAAVTAVDDRTVEVSFDGPQPGWYTPFVSGSTGSIYPEHILAAGPSAHDAFLRQPIGTGPYVVESLTVENTVSIAYAINERYREPTKPSFARVTVETGGDAVEAAEAVFETGTFDLAPTLQVAGARLKEIAKGDNGDLVVVPGAQVEAILLNFSDPETEVDRQRSHWQTPNPVLADRAVRRALALGIDRGSISEQFFLGSPGEPPTPNILVGLPAFTSKNTSWAFDVEEGRRLLDQAGWVLDGDVRKKDGVDLALTFAVPNESPQQQIQEVVKQGWEALGVRVEVLEINPDIFFNLSPNNELDYTHMYYDAHEYSFGPLEPVPLEFLQNWLSHNGENIAQRENLWQQPNESRYHNPDYDALYDAAATETDPAQLAATLTEMNDLLIDDAAVIPLVQLAAEAFAIAKTLRQENIAAGPFEPLTWNIANWNGTE
ncbi:MAG: peptide/nickel transport system substrate-binding protein [Thermomicrobiales bacterium]|nr:peptide/nickel transport system substrate-binding protein [Thermomicrobiales bacterium]